MTDYVNPSTRLSGAKQIIVSERVSTSGLVQEPPVDGGQYTWRDGEWVDIAPEIAEINVALATAQIELDEAQAILDGVDAKVAQAKAEAIAAAELDAQEKADLAEAAALAAAATDAQAKADAAEAAAIAAAAIHAEAEAAQAEADALAAAALDAQAKADAAQAAALAAAATDAQAKADAAQAAAEVAAAADAAAKAAQAQADAIAAAALDAQAKADAAEAAAIAAAAADATTKANAAKSEAIAAAALDAEAKADQAAADAIAAAALDAQDKADLAEAAAIAAAATDAQSKADAAEAAAIAAAATDASAKAAQAEADALAAAALDAQAKADAALAAAQQDATDKAAQAEADALAAAALDAQAKADAAEAAALAAAATDAQAKADAAEAAAIAQAAVDAAAAYGGTKALVQTWTASDEVHIDGGALQADSVTTLQLAADAVEANNIKAGAVIAGKLAADSVLANNIKAGEIDTQHLAAGSVQAGQIDAAAVDTIHLAADAVTADKIVAGAIGVDELAANSVVSAKIAANAVVAGKVAADAILAGNIKAGEIGTNHLAALSVSAGKLAADSVTADKIVALNVTGDKIAANAITAGKIAANAITAGKIAANAVTADKLAANMILTSDLIAGTDLNAMHTRIGPGGIRVFTPSPDGGLQESIKLGVAGENAELKITDAAGGVVASIDPEGKISGQRLSVDEFVEVGGFPLLGHLADYTPAIGVGALMDGHLDKVPRGIASYGFIPTNVTWNSSSGNVYRASFVAEPGRTYRIVVSGFMAQIGGANLSRGVVLRYRTPTSPGSSSLGSTQSVAYAYQTSANVNHYVTYPPMIYTLRCNKAGLTGGGELNPGRNEIIVDTNASSNAPITVYNASGANGISVTVEDIGLDFPTTGQYVYESTVEPKQTYTTVWECNGSRTYNGDSNLAASPQPSDMVHGPVPGANSNNRYSIATFGGNSVSSTAGNEVGKTISSALSGATLKKVEVYLYANHWYYSSGGTAHIRQHTSTSLPSTGSYSGSKHTEPGWPNPGGRWVDITTIATTSIRGVTIGATGTTAYTTYGRFNGNGQSSEPKLRLTYEK